MEHTPHINLYLNDFSRFIRSLLEWTVPVPYLSGEGFAQIGGPDDYSEIEKRKDILVYTSGKMEEGLTIAGKITGRIFISSDCEDTDFTMKILDVHQDGYAQRLQDGITRLRYRNGPFQEASYEPGKITF